MASRPQRPPWYDALRGFDSQRDFGRFAAEGPPGWQAADHAAQEDRNYNFQVRELGPVEEGNVAQDPRVPDIRLLQHLYDALEAAEQQGIHSGVFNGVDLDGARRIIGQELFLAHQQNQRMRQPAPARGAATRAR